MGFPRWSADQPRCCLSESCSPSFVFAEFVLGLRGLLGGGGWRRKWHPVSRLIHANIVHAVNTLFVVSPIRSRLRRVPVFTPVSNDWQEVGNEQQDMPAIFRCRFNWLPVHRISLSLMVVSFGNRLRHGAGVGSQLRLATCNPSETDGA